jgi:glycosyltransferase involved in cell wall biosynthesis
MAGKQPAVSVIVPNYNHERYLPDRLNSIFAQTYRDFEVILLDDASSDGSPDLLEEYRNHADVRIIRNKTNSGSPFNQWLKGLDLARADLIWIAESDDRCEPDFLESLLPAFDEAQTKLAFANSHVLDENNAIVGAYDNTEYLTTLSRTKWTRPYRTSGEQEINQGLGVKNTILSASAVVFRRFPLTTTMRKVLKGLRIAGDWYLFIHAISGGDIFYTPRKLNFHRRHSESVIGKLLKENRVKEFFREFYTVQSAIFKRYRLTDDFRRKWEEYLRQQWEAFYPDRPFEELEDYYPIERAREACSAVGRMRQTYAPTSRH